MSEPLIRPTPAASSHEPCEGCGACLDRRDFFRTSLGLAALAVFAAMFPEGAAADGVRWTRGASADGLLRYPVPATDGVEVDRANELILVRRGHTVFAFALSCPHQRSMLRWREADGIFQCTKHHSEYSPLGEFLKGRATRNMDRLGVRLEGHEIVVDPDTVIQSDQDPQGWASAVVTVP